MYLYRLELSTPQESYSQYVHKLDGYHDWSVELICERCLKAMAGGRSSYLIFVKEQYWVTKLLSVYLEQTITLETSFSTFHFHLTELKINVFFQN